MVEGVRAGEEAVRAGAEIRLALVAPRLRESPGGPRLLDDLARGAAPLREVPDDGLRELSDTEAPQGVLLVCGRAVHDLEGVVGDPGILVLDGVQDPGNVGTLVRSAHAFGLAGVVALPGTADPWSAKAVRGSAGSVLHVPIVQASARDLLEWTARSGVGLKVAEAHPGGGGAPAAAVADGTGGAGEPWALVIGNEGSGVGEAIRGVPHTTVSIALPGGAESLNAGVAGSILMYELTRRSE